MKTLLESLNESVNTFHTSESVEGWMTINVNGKNKLIYNVEAVNEGSIRYRLKEGGSTTTEFFEPNKKPVLVDTKLHVNGKTINVAIVTKIGDSSVQFREEKGGQTVTLFYTDGKKAVIK